MAKKPKKRLTAAQRAEMIQGVPVDEFIRRNADPIWLHQHGYWEFLDAKSDIPGCPPP